jgi:glutamate-1-semialdehyde 2,1-aminomutase
MYGHQSTRLLPDDFPQFFERAKGAYIWDLSGGRYLDLMCAYGPNLLGYGHETVDRAYIRQLESGDTMTGPSKIMVELAESLVELVSHADWAMFCKNGTDATTMAIMTARACTGRSMIIRAKGAYHGAAPWCNPNILGATAGDRADQIVCNYNDVASLEAAVELAGRNLAAILAAPFRHDVFVDQAPPNPTYAKRARELCDETGALLIVDEVRAGLRVARDSSWASLRVSPDLSCWGKCIANGHPISALVGSDKAREAAASIYVTGSFWFSAAAMAASVETLRIVRTSDYLERIQDLGDRLRRGLNAAATSHNIRLRQTGPSQMPLFLFDDDPELRQGFFWSSQMIQRGVYVHPWHNMFLCAAMTEADIDMAIDAADGAFNALRLHSGVLPAVKQLKRPSELRSTSEGKSVEH